CQYRESHARGSGRSAAASGASFGDSAANDVSASAIESDFNPSFAAGAVAAAASRTFRTPSLAAGGSAARARAANQTQTITTAKRRVRIRSPRVLELT